MGPYLAKPKTKVNCFYDENDRFSYCSAEMQGWRKTQEDAHVVFLNFDDDKTAFFAVFDGHGGEEVSKYCSLHFPQFIKSSLLYKEKKIKEALEKSFLEFDQTLKKPDVIQELKKLASIDLDGEENEIDAEETSKLKKEALLPIEEVIKNTFNASVSNKSITTQNGIEDDSNKNNESSDDRLVLNNSKNEKPEPLFFKQGAALELFKAFMKDYDDDEESEDDEEEDETEHLENDEESENDDEESDLDENDDETASEENDEEFNEQKKYANLRDNFRFENSDPGNESGCTAIVALIRENILYVANVGDSRCVLSRKGIAIDMSEDHKPEDEIEKKRIIKAGGNVTLDGRVNGGLNLSRALGDHSYKNNTKLNDLEQMIIALPDIKTCELDSENDNFLILACDGIWNSMSNQEVVDFVNEHLQNSEDLKEICEKLFAKCLAPNADGDGSGCDNMTCILILFKNTKSLLNNNNKRNHEDSSENEKIALLNNNEHSNISKKLKIIDEEDLFKPGSSKS